MRRALPPQTELLVLQATPFCNIDCAYCYLPNRTDRRRMDDGVLDASFRRVFRSRFAQDRITVLWHAGEPLAVPREWYEHAMLMAERARPPGLLVEHHIQTNGTLLTEAWLDLLRRADMRIGLSLDGPADLHDARRRTRSGGGTFAQAMRGARLLREAGIGFHVITVLGRATLDHADRLYEFYVEHGIRDVAFNIDEQDGAAGPSTLNSAGSVAAFRAFLRRFLARMAAEPGRLTLREATDMLGVIRARGLHGRRAQDAQPMRIVSIAIDGSVSTFSPELLGIKDARYGDFIFGNICRDSLETIHGRVERSVMLADIERGIAGCARECAYFPYCGGGSPCNKIGERNDPGATETLFCRLMRKELFEAVLEAVESAMPGSETRWAGSGIAAAAC